MRAARACLPGMRCRNAGHSPASALARVPGEDRPVVMQALADAIIYRAAAAAEPCPDCAVHPALLCVVHAAEMDWVSVYREMLPRGTEITGPSGEVRADLGISA
jgi:hypothetical protein